MAKKQMYSFTEKKHSKNGILSSVLAGISLLIFLILAGMALLTEGGVGLYAGGAGLSAMIISFTGLVFGIRSFSERDRLYFFSKLGSTACGIIMIGWLAVLLIGI